MRKKQAALIIDCRQAQNLPNTTYLIKPIMKRNFKTLAGMAVCALGVFATSSCTKDEFFGLEDSVVIDASTKYEIAMSQEYADYARACFNFVEAFAQEPDTTQMQSYVGKDGKTVYYNTSSSSQQNALELLEALKKVYPELAKADKTDFAEILDIALANNESLSDIAANNPRQTKSYYSYQAQYWLASIGSYNGYWAYADGCYFDFFGDVYSAVHSAIYGLSEVGAIYGAGGLVWGDYSAVSITTSFGEYWPNICNSGSPSPEADFIVLPTMESVQNIYPGEINFGGGYYMNNRWHYIYNLEGDYIIY